MQRSILSESVISHPKDPPPSLPSLSLRLVVDDALHREAKNPRRVSWSHKTQAVLIHDVFNVLDALGRGALGPSPAQSSSSHAGSHSTKVSHLPSGPPHFSCLPVALLRSSCRFLCADRVRCRNPSGELCFGLFRNCKYARGSPSGRHQQAHIRPLASRN